MYLRTGQSYRAGERDAGRPVEADHSKTQGLIVVGAAGNNSRKKKTGLS